MYCYYISNPKRKLRSYLSFFHASLHSITFFLSCTKFTLIYLKFNVREMRFQESQNYLSLTFIKNRKYFFAASQIFKKSCNAKILINWGTEPYIRLSLRGNSNPSWSVTLWDSLVQNRRGQYLSEVVGSGYWLKQASGRNLLSLALESLQDWIHESVS